jgi:glycosyltransferase involved in cell wall biosynthesis
MPDDPGREAPVPDYLVLRDCLQPDILDTHTISAIRHPAVIFAERAFGRSWAIGVAAFLRAGRYDAIIATGEDVGLKLAFFAKFLRRHVPLIFICHNISTPRRAFYFRALKVGSAVRTFLCLSKAQARILTERYGIGPEHVRLMFWHVDHNFFQPDPQATVRNQISSAGMASRDYATLVQATRDLDVDVKIAADSPWFQQTLNITHDNMPARVEVRSWGTYTALRQLYAESLFVVVPLLNVDYSAGYTVILEAMAMGKAVIVTRIKQQDDFVVDGWNGFYVEPGDVAGLRDRIRFLLEHPDEAIRLGKNGRQMVEEQFTLDDHIRRVEDAVQDVVQTFK